MICVWKNEFIRQRDIRPQRFRMFETFLVAAPKDIHRDPQLIPAHFVLTRNFVGIDVDQFYNPVAICTACRSDEIHHWRSSDVERRRQWRCHVGENIGTIGECPLVGDQPASPRIRVSNTNGTRNIRDRFGGIGNVFVIVAGAVL